MRKKSLIVSVVLLCAFCFMISGLHIFPQAKAESSSTITTLDKAQILNKLTLLKGDNGDYNLSDKLLRSEAATFIVRIMGKEEHVLGNQEDYWVTRFPDVISTKWHAPYIGYCSRNGIIGGDEAGNFKPDESISEKAFLKLMIGSLGYEYGIDFSWDDVYRKAYETGLVKDSIYLTKTLDNLKYTRGQVVDVLYNSLSLESVITKTTLLEGLVREKVISRELANSVKIGQNLPEVGEETKTSVIEQIFVVDQNRLFIRLKDDIQKITEDQIKIYSTKDFTNKLKITIDSQSEKTIVLQTSEQVALESYTIEIRNSVYTDSKKTTTLTGVFSGFSKKEFKSDFFRISKVQAISKNIVQVFFTHPVNINSEDSSYYQIMLEDEIIAQGDAQSITAKVIGSEGETIALYLNGKELSEDVNYTLKISGNLTSSFGCRLNEGLGDSARFKGTAIENQGLKMTKLSVLDNNTIQLDFNKEINPVLAKQIYNFYITGENNIPIPIKKSNVVKHGENSNKSVVIGTQIPFAMGKNYTIMINNINDTTRQHSITEKEYPFVANYSVKSNFAITYAYAIDNTTAIIQFNKMLDAESAVNPLNYQISVSPDMSYIGSPSKVFYDEVNKPYEVKLFYPTGKTMETGKIYKIKIFGAIQDYLGNNLLTASEYAFAGTNVAPIKPAISDAVIISKDTIKIRFNKELEYETPNILPGNYVLQYVSVTNTLRKVPISVIYINPTTLVLKFDSLDFDTNYNISALELKDYSGAIINLNTSENNSVKVRLGK